MNRQIIMWDQGWGHMKKGITKVKRIIAKLPEPQFTSEEYMSLYETIYTMCTQDPPNDYAPQLYEKYKETFDEYITSTVLPSLREKQHDESFLRELTKSWANHKVMVFWMSRFFHYLDRVFIAKRSLPGTKEAGLNSFRDVVYREVNVTARDVVIGLINKERDGESIDRALLRNVTDMFVEIDMGKMDAYELDLEGPLLKDTADYYSRKASSWIAEDSYKDYMSKAEECLRRESEISHYYLYSSSEVKLLDKVKHELLVVYATQLHEKEQSASIDR